MQSTCEPPSRAVLTLESLSVYFCGKVFVSSTFHWSLARKVETTVFCCLNGRYTCLYSGGLPSPWSPGAALEGRNSPHWWAWKKWTLVAWSMNVKTYQVQRALWQIVPIYIYSHVYISNPHARLTRFFLKGVCSGPLSLGKDLWQVQVTHLWQWCYATSETSKCSVSISLFLSQNKSWDTWLSVYKVPFNTAKPAC